MTPIQILACAAGLTLLLYAIPGGRVVGRPLVLLATLVHELGHGFAAMLVGGSFKHLKLWFDGSGMAAYEGRFSAPGRAIVAAGGPLGPPIVALGLFFAAGEGRAAQIVLIALGAGLVLVALIWIRNAFGVAFVLALGAAMALLAWSTSERTAQIADAFLAIQMSLSAFSRGDYLFKAQARTNAGPMPSDTAQIAHALFLPHWFWGALIALLSLAICTAGLWLCAGAINHPR